MGETFASALDEHNKSEEAEDKEKSQEEKAEAAGDEKRAKGAAVNVIARKMSLREKFEDWKNKLKQTSLLQKLVSGQKKFSEGWDAIFSKSGLITMSLLAGIPLLMKAFDWISSAGGLGKVIENIGGSVKDAIFAGISKILCNMGIPGFCDGGTPTERTDVGGEVITSDTAVEHAVVGGVKGTAYAGSKLIQAGKFVGTQINRVVEGGKSIYRGGKAIVDATKKVYEIGKNVFTKPTPSTFDPRKVLTSMDDGARGITKPTIVKDSIAAKMETFASKLESGVSEIAEKAVKDGGGKSGKIGGVVKKIMSSITGLLKNPKVIAKFSPQIVAGVAKATGGMIPVIGWAMTVGFTAWGGITGFFEANKLFGLLPEEKSDWYMDLISAAMKAFINTSWFILIGVADDICQEMLQFSFIRKIAELLYEFFAGSEAMAKMREGQQRMEDARVAYNTKEGTNISPTAWNDKVNKSAMTRAWEGTKGAVNAVYDPLAKLGFKMGVGLSEGYYTAKDMAGRAWDKTKEVAGNVWGATKEFGKSAYNTLANVGQKIGNGVSNAYYATKDYLVDKFNKSSIGKDTIARKFGDGAEVTTGRRLSSVAGDVISNLTFGAIDGDKASKVIYGSFLLLKDKIKEITDSIKAAWDEKVAKPFGEAWKNIKKDWEDNISKPLAQWWTEVKQSWNDKMVAFGKIWEDLKKGFSEAWDKEVVKPISKWWDDVKKDWNRIMEAFGQTWEDMKAGWKEKVTEPLAQWWEDVKKSWNDKMVAFGKIWEDLKKGFSEAWDKEVVKPISKWWDDVKKDWTVKVVDPAVQFWKDLKDGWNKKIVEPALGVWSNIQYNWKSKVEEPLIALKDKISGFFGGAVSTATARSDQETINDLLIKAKKYKYSDGLDDKTVWTRIIGDGASYPQADTVMKSLAAGQGGGNVKYNMKGGFGEAFNNFSYYAQSDPNWGRSPYPKSSKGTFTADVNQDTLGYRGCGPTAMAMVATQLTGKDVTPPALARFSYDRGFSVPAGTSWDFFPAIAKKFGFNMVPMTSASEAKNFPKYLMPGQPVILSGQSTEPNTPFTANGHFVVATALKGDKVVINNPISKERSGEYRLSDIMRQVQGAWAFSPTDKMQVDPNMSFIGGDTGATGTKKISILDAIGEVFSSATEQNEMLKLVNEIGGLQKDVLSDLFDITIEDPNAPSSSGSSFSLPASASSTDWSSYKGLDPHLLQNILNKTIQTTIAGESSGKYSLARNDINASTGQKISPSVGILQWRGDNAKSLFKKIYEKLPNDQEAAYYANQVDWNNDAPWSENAQKKLQSFLERVKDVNKSVQDDYLVSYVKNNNLDPVVRYAMQPGLIKDPRALVMLADFANTGPDNVRTFMNIYNKYDPTSGGSEFDHFYNEFKTKSYWGRHSGIYKGRYSNLYGSLNSWNLGGGMGAAPYMKSSLGLTDSKVSANLRNYTGAQSGKMTEELLQRAVSTLNEISGHTGNVYSGINDLANKGIKINVNATGNMSTSYTQSPNGDNNIVLSNPNLNNTIPLSTQLQQNANDKDRRNYSLATSIAKGRI
jgi:hypothetical protein